MENLHEKLIEIRKCVPYLKQDKKSYNYSYVSGTAILGHIQEKMNELGVLLYPSVSNRAMTAVDKDFIVEADMIMTWQDAKTKEKIEVPFLLFGKQNDPSKAFGSGLTYSERYFLLKFFNIPTDDEDPDRFKKKMDNGIKPVVQQSKKTNTGNKVTPKTSFENTISKMSSGIPLIDFEKMVKSYGVQLYKDITDRTAQESFYTELQAKIKEQPEKGELPFDKPE